MSVEAQVRSTGTQRGVGPERYGRYEIVSKLATGGMGEVFLAKSIGAAGFQKHVVIKKILPHLTERKHIVEGLVREAKLLVLLDHPNIVQVLDLGREREDYFMAMEFVHGYNLATIAHFCAQKRQLIPAPACAFIGLSVLAGLEYAHRLTGVDGTRHNIIHRDVSPQNVLISRDGRVKLTDFGIAKVLNEAEGEVTRSLKGKFRYMAPEAVNGGRIDQRYDLFATGILLFEALCRRHLFGGRNDIDILNQVRETRVPPISRYHPNVAPALAEVVERSLRRDPGERFQTAAEFSEALREAIQPVSEDEAGRVLRRFVEELYPRPDFPLNKPKLPDLENPDPTVTRALVLSSDIAADGTPPLPSISRSMPRGDRPHRSMTLLWFGFVAISGVVGYLSYMLLVRQGSPSEEKSPVVIKVEKRDRAGLVEDARSVPLPDLETVATSADVAPPRKIKARRPPRRVVTFNEDVGRAAFARAGHALRRCFDRHASPEGTGVSLKVVSVIRAGGRVEKVEIRPASQAESELGKCIKGVAQRIRYPRHDQQSVRFVQPLRAQRK